jgi:hypothetical protein
MRLMRGFNNTAFSYDLTSRTGLPPFVTEIVHFNVIYVLQAYFDSMNIQRPIPEVPKLWGAPLPGGGAVDPLGGPELFV